MTVHLMLYKNDAATVVNHEWKVGCFAVFAAWSQQKSNKFEPWPRNNQTEE